MFNVGDLVRLVDLRGHYEEDVKSRDGALYISDRIALGDIVNVTLTHQLATGRQRIRVAGSSWWCSSENFELVESVDRSQVNSKPKGPVAKTGYGFDYS